MRSMSPYLDKWGMILAGPAHDGGDTAANMGTYYFCHAVMPEHAINWPRSTKVYWEIALFSLQRDGLGKFIRHPDRDKWYSNTKTFSRDQLIPMLCAMGMYQNKKELKAFIWDHLKRGLLFMPNTKRNWAYPPGHPEWRHDKPWDDKAPDPTGPEIWAMLIRAMRAWYLYPLLPVFDLEALLSSIIKVFHREKSRSGHIGDHRNHMLSLMFSSVVYPTPVSYLARLIYKWSHNVQDVADKWWSERRKEPPMNELLRPLIEKYL